MNKEQIFTELFALSGETLPIHEAIARFIDEYCYIYSNDEGGWINFDLWDTDCAPYQNQRDLIEIIVDNRKVVALKARQIGITWICLCVCLWYMLFQPEQYILLLSKGEDPEAKELMKRLKGIYGHLPPWLKASSVVVNNALEWELSNGSKARSVSTKGGDSMSFTIAVIDEADLIHRSGTSLKQVLLNVEPTVGMHGKLVMISKSEKERPQSKFKNVYRAAAREESEFADVFIPYYVHPGRTPEWRRLKEETALAEDGNLDSVFESYPGSPEEALMPLSSNKRLNQQALLDCFEDARPLHVVGAHKLTDEFIGVPDVPGLHIYEPARPKQSYLIVADPAGGEGGGDKTALIVFNVDGTTEAATLSIEVETDVLGEYIYKLAKYYNNAAVIWERNNHGLALATYFRLQNRQLRKLQGWDRGRGRKKKHGWLSNQQGKSLAYDMLAPQLNLSGCAIRDSRTYHQLASIERRSLKAPKGQEDDLAICYAIGVATIEMGLIPSFTMDTIKV